MTSKFFALLISALAVFAISTPAHAQNSCNPSFRNLFGLIGNSKADWRSSLSNRTGDPVILSKESEQVMKDFRESVDEAVFRDSSTVAIEIELQQNAWMSVINPPADYGTGKFPKYEVENVKDGKVGLVLGLPVSGHAGTDNARIWAKTDLYNIRIEKEVNGRYVEHQLISKQQSRDATTFHELNLQMEKGVTYKLSYWRDGSAGPYGYPEGRFIELVWNGNN